MKKSTWISFEQLEAFMVVVFQSVGVPESDARICADVLITSDRCGIDSHGVGRLKPINDDRITKQQIQQPINDALQKKLIEMRDEQNLTQHHFSFES